jgi:hypothetical protein
VGLAFQAKMIEAWLVLPALALAYLVAAGDGWRRRIAHLGIAGLVTAAVSLMTDPRLVWVADHCFPLKSAGGASGGLRFVPYFCGRLGL